MIDFSKIYEGWRNELIPPAKLKKMIAKVAKERLAICSECPYNSKHHKTMRPDVHCIICGCTLRAKVKCLSCDCPELKWLKVITEEQEDVINGETAS